MASNFTSLRQFQRTVKCQQKCTGVLDNLHNITEPMLVVWCAVITDHNAEKAA